MAWVKKGLWVAGGVAVGLIILNFATRSFAPGLRSYLGLSA